MSNESTAPHRVARGVRRVARTMSAIALGILGLLTHRAGHAGTTARWIELGPPPAVRLPMVYDTNRSRALIFDDTVIWAASNDPIPKWSKIWEGVSLPTSSPSIESNQVWVYDPARDRIWRIMMRVTGTSMSFPGRVWTMDLGTMPLAWVERSFSNPAPDRSGFATVFDAPRDRILLFGGNFGCIGCITNEVLILNLSGTPTWSSATVVGTPPTPRYEAVAVHDPIRDRMLFYGGYFIGPPNQPSFTTFDETWALSLTSDPMTWSFLTPTTAVAYARWRTLAAYDTTAQRMIVTGGITNAGGEIINDTWALDLSLSAPADQALWTAVAAGPADVRPPGRTMSIGWLDADRSRLLRYGSGQATFTAATDPRFDLWSLSLIGTPAWSAIHADSVRPPMHVGHVAFPDASGLNWVIGLGDPGGLFERPTVIDSTVPWHPIGSGGPGVRFWPGAVVDVAGSRALVFGGGSSSTPMTLGTEHADLWSYDFATGWSQLAPIGAPSVRAEALTLFDASRRRLIVHGGRYSAINKVRERSDTWMYDVASNTWSELAAGTFGGRWAEAGIYDPVRDRLIAVGGRDTLQTFSDLHALPLGAGGTWTPLPASGPAPPLSFVQSVRAAYDAPRDRLIVVGYRSDQMRVFALSLDATPTWTEIEVDGVLPSPRQDYAAAVDLTGGRMLISGGRGIGSGNIDEDWVLVFDETTPVAVSLASTDATAERVRIRWQVDGSTNALFAAYRRTPGAGWSNIAPLLVDGSGFVTLEDREVDPGDRFDYRLGVSEGGAERFFGEVSVVVPMTNGVRLDGARPNPVSGTMWVSFALATDAPATLEVVDVMGRRILERAVGPLGPGEHTLRVSEPGRLPAGLYLVRLTQGGERRITKFVVAR